MSNPIRIWTCAAFHPAFRCGGWASVRVDNGQIVGAAGGERNTAAARMALAGLVWALRGLPPVEAADRPIDVITTSADLASVEARLKPFSSADIPAPDQDLDLWAQLLMAAKGRRLGVTRVLLEPDTPIAFATAWADLAMDKAKAGGPFLAAIPKPNLAKVRGLDAK